MKKDFLVEFNFKRYCKIHENSKSNLFNILNNSLTHEQFFQLFLVGIDNFFNNKNNNILINKICNQIPCQKPIFKINQTNKTINKQYKYFMKLFNIENMV